MSVGFDPAGHLGEEFSHLVAEHVDRRHHHVAGALTGELNDPFAEVGLQRLYPGFRQRPVEMDLFAGHALALDGQLYPPGAGQVGDVGVGLFGGAGQEDRGAGGFGIAGEFVEVVLVIGPHLVLDAGNLLAQRFEIETGEGFLPGNHVGIAEAVQSVLQLRRRQRLSDARLVLFVTLFIHGGRSSVSRSNGSHRTCR